MNDVVIEKGSGGLGRRIESEDSTSGLVVNGYSVVGGVQYDTPYLLASLDDAVSLGITPDYDINNNVLVYEHIKEFFRIAPNAKLWFMLCDEEDYEPLIATHAVNLLRHAEGQIRRMAIAWNILFDVEYEVPLEHGSPQVRAISKAQEIAVSEFTEHRPVFFILEGKKINLNNPFNVRGLNAENVMVVVGQSLSVAQRDTIYNSYGAVGTALGARAKAAVNVKHSWVDRFNCYGGSLTAAGINGNKIESLSKGTLEALDAAGYQFFRTHTGISGYYFNSTATATSATSDYAYAENVETMNKAARLVRAALLPYVDSPQKIDPKTGKLSPEVVKQFETAGRKGLEEMLRNDEVSAIDIYVDPNQNLLATSELVVKFEIIPTGSTSKITAKLGFKNPF
ncbi:MAG: hypothetical protein HPY80_03480 [Bacteroidales bacterium]|nr:hypothetical protein [Bacteroidales bacterium]